MDVEPADSTSLRRFLQSYSLGFRTSGRALTQHSTEIRDFGIAAPQPTPPKPATATEAMTTFLKALREHCIADRTTDRTSNIWAIAGVGRNELRTTAILAWILDSGQDHGFGDAVLAALLDRVKAQLPPDFRLGENYSVLKEFCSFGDRENRIDILIEDQNCTFFIECKIDAPEGRNQLSRYVEKARQRATCTGRQHWRLIYISRIKPQLETPDIIHIQWPDISAAIHAAIEKKGHPDTFSSQAFIQFANHVNSLYGARSASIRP